MRKNSDREKTTVGGNLEVTPNVQFAPIPWSDCIKQSSFESPLLLIVFQIRYTIETMNEEHV